MMDTLVVLTGLISSAFLAGGVLAFAGLGETVGQRAGVFNLGIEGFMAMGGIAAIAAVSSTGSLPQDQTFASRRGRQFTWASVIFSRARENHR